jgi:hypothetical protein
VIAERPSKPIADVIPDPQEVRERLCQNVREKKVLRQLLRIAVRVEACREHDSQLREVARA